MMNNLWDHLSQHFNTHKFAEKIPPGAADNILIAWPVILKFLERNKTHGKQQILDYGCGTGGFVKELLKHGYNVDGIDLSEKMINIAIENVKGAQFKKGDISILPTVPKYNSIVSIMAFQFIEDIETTISKLSMTLRKSGLFIFAVFNPDFVKDGIDENILFEDFDSFSNPKSGFTNFPGNIKIPTYIRTSTEYDSIVLKNGFTKLLEDYPHFSKKFLATYRMGSPTHCPEYLILGYQKSQ